MKQISLFLFMTGLVIGHAFTQGLYDRSTVQNIEIFFGFSNWDSQLDALASTTEDYLLADSVRINGVVYDSVGVKYKGNSSYNANNNKNPLHIELNYIHGGYNYQGYTDLKLQNGYQDPSMIREVLSYAVLEQYMDCPKANFANVYINGSLRGVYSNAESINGKFNGDHYFSSDGAFIKCNPVGGAGPGGNGNPDLKYLGVDTTLYTSRYELKSDFGWTDLVEMINVLNNDFGNIENYLDLDRAIWMLAFNNVLVNLDSYSGAFRQNYYLYNDLNERFVPTVWDLNMSFAGFPGGTGSGQLTTPWTLDPFSNSASANHPLIVKILANPMYKRMYMAHVRTMVQEIFASGNYISTANQLQNSIDTYVLADPFKFFTYAQFQGGLTANVNTGGPGPGMTTYGIQNLMDQRVAFFNSNPDYQLVGPNIVSYAVSNVTPSVGEAVFVTATCTNETIVYMGYRMDHPLRFNRVQMFDDGAHGDGAAGDNVYGVDVTLTSSEMEFYFYAENSFAGMFSPQRAEHEFYSLLASAPFPSIGDVLINEILASNSSYGFDNYGEHNDWIELYNTTSNVFDLGGLYLSDDPANITKWEIPAGTILPAGEVLVIWADNDTLQSGLHANFKLNSAGEELILTDGIQLYDYLNYFTQITDVAYARCPDGQTFIYGTPTFNALNNCYVSVEDLESDQLVFVFPNPAEDFLNIKLSNGEEVTISVIDLQGRLICSEQMKGDLIELSTNDWKTGYYRLIIKFIDGSTRNLPVVKN